jgi:very-short-patch-repair endonuclease
MTKSNTEEFIRKSIELWGNKYDYSLVEYKTMQLKVKIKYNDWIYEQSPENHLLGKKCEKRWDTDKFIHFSKKIHGNKYDYSKVLYINMFTPIELILNGISYKQTPEKHLMGREVEKGFSLKTNEEFISDAIKIWNNKYNYSLVDYKGAHTPIKIIFENEIYSQTPSSHLNGMNCERDTIKSQEDFLRKAIKKHGENKYDYSLVEYKGIENKVKIIYEGKIYEQKAGAHLYAGLPENNKFRKTTEEFIQESNLIHSNVFDYSKVNYINNSIKVTIICPIHGEFNQNPSSHLQGAGCPNCVESRGEKIIDKILKKFKINFDRQKKFPDCKNIRELPFDFYIPSMRLCIEFDGIQHHKPLPFFGGQEAFERLKINDKIKNDYCEDNYINLIRIRYDEVENIEKILKGSIMAHRVNH